MKYPFSYAAGWILIIVGFTIMSIGIIALIL